MVATAIAALNNCPTENQCVRPVSHIFCHANRKLIALPILDEFKSRGSLRLTGTALPTTLKVWMPADGMPNWYPMMKFCKASFLKCWRNWKTTKQDGRTAKAKFDEVNELEDDVGTKKITKYGEARNWKNTKRALKPWKANAKKPIRNTRICRSV